MVKVYIIREGYAESLRADDDLVGFQEYVEDGVYWQSYEFSNPTAAGAFWAGVCPGHSDERAPMGFLILRDDIEDDIPYIQTLIDA